MATYDLEVKNEKGEVVSRVGDITCVESVISSTGTYSAKIGVNAGVFVFVGFDMFNRSGALTFIDSFDGENLVLKNFYPNKIYLGRI